MKIRFDILMLVITLTTLVACSSEKSQFGILFDQACDMTSPYDHAGEVRTFTFNATTAWSVTTEAEASWLGVEPSAGEAGFGQFNIVVDENTSSEERYAHVVVRSGGESLSIEVVQQRKPLFEREEMEVYTIGAEGGTIDIDIATNKEYTISIATTERWITAEVEATRALRSERITFAATPNDGELARVAMVSIVSSDGAVLDTFDIVQATERSATNEIVYHTDDNTLAALSTVAAEEYGAELRSHFYDAERACCRMVFGSNVRRIPERCFAQQSHITQILLPERLEAIANGAFAGCTGCHRFVIPRRVTTIGSAIFEGCAGMLITECNIPSSNATAAESGHWLYGSTFDHVEVRGKVGARAFSGYGLRSVTFGEGVGAVSVDAFAACGALESVYAPSVASWCGINFGNGEANPLNSGNVALIIDNEVLTELDVDSEVEAIGPYAFYNYVALESITLGDGVKSIGRGAFELCDARSIALGRGIRSVGRGALYGCRCDVLSIAFTLPDFGYDATSASHWLWGIEVESIVIGDGVTTIGNLALSNIAALRSVTIEGSLSELGEGVFANNASLEHISLGSGLERLSRHTLYGCCALVEVHLPASITTIEEYALQGCSALRSIYMGPGVSYIGNYALQGCCALEALHIAATTPPTLGGNYALDTRSASLVVYVPASSLEAYRTAEGWSSLRCSAQTEE